MQKGGFLPHFLNEILASLNPISQICGFNIGFASALHVDWGCIQTYFFQTRVKPNIEMSNSSRTNFKVGTLNGSFFTKTLRYTSWECLCKVSALRMHWMTQGMLNMVPDLMEASCLKGERWVNFLWHRPVICACLSAPGLRSKLQKEFHKK